ncbi:uncharacterized protein [Branchiostoma lanceolatum]|uniref:uncharacterized protein n=1 Tax=Branchiostoma lanceolatum TaxID=7740 RepID=UPI003454FFAB
MSDIGEKTVNMAESDPGDLGPSVVEEEMINTVVEESQGSKPKRKRTDLSPYKDELVALWNRGMQSVKSEIGKQLIEECIQSTKLEKRVIEQWIRNHKSPPVPQHEKVVGDPFTTITSKRRKNGYDLFRKDYLPGKSGATVTGEAGRAWTAIKNTPLGKEYEERAKKVKVLQPHECDKKQRQKDIQKLYDQLNETLQKLQACNCDAVAVVYNHNTKRGYMDGTPKGHEVMDQVHPNMFWDFGLGFSGTSSAEKPKTPQAMKDEVKALFTEKWRLSSGKTTRFPYAAWRRGEVTVEGLPEGFFSDKKRKPGEMGTEKLQVILDCREEICVKLQGPESLDTNDMDDDSDDDSAGDSAAQSEQHTEFEDDDATANELLMRVATDLEEIGGQDREEVILEIHQPPERERNVWDLSFIDTATTE